MILESPALIESAPLHWVDVPVPEPGENEIRIKVRCCGLCRTDLHVIEGELPRRRLPLIPGHQIVGVVDKTGDESQLFKTGDRVGIAWLRKTCGGCEFCLTGRENLCPFSKYTGYDDHGGYAEYAVVNEHYAYKIPDIFSDEEAVPLLCAGIVGYRALRRSLLPNGGTLAIFGFGSSAHMVIQIALHRGCRVLVVTRGEKHRSLAKAMGAFWVGEKASELPEKVDSAIIFAPAGELVPEALLHLKSGGTLSLAGIHMSEIPKLDYSEHLFFERNVHSVTANTREDGFQFLREAAEARLKSHITVFPLKEANLALLQLKGDLISGTGILKI